MNFKAQSTFTPVDLVKVEASFIPRVVAAVTAACAAVVAEAQLIAPVETGDYRGSIHTAAIEVTGSVVTGGVTADSAHAAYVEFGTGQRGAASPLAGAGPYSPTWPGMAAQAPMRRGIDAARPAIREAFAAEGFQI